MAGLFGLFAGGNAAAATLASKPAYTIEHLQQLHNKLQQLVSTEEQNRENTMVEVVRQITEALIWGEQNGRDFFDFFCEKQILAEFVHILSLPRVAKTVKVQLLQTLSMLVQNIRRDTSLYYLFSNNYVNQLISMQLDWSDEEILSYYISFLKSLAMRLNPETVKFFFNERLEQFPLYVEAIRFFAHRDQMVRTAVRTLTLQVYSIKDAAMQSFVLALSSQTYFRHLTCYLRELWDRLDGATERAASWALPGGHYDQAAAAVLEANEQHKDLLMYISDVLDLEVPALSGALAARVLKDALFPVLLGSLFAGASDSSEPASVPLGAAGEGVEPLRTAADGNRIAPAKHHVSRTCALFVLHQVLDVCRSRALLEPLAAALLSESLPPDIQGYCMSSPAPPPATYGATTDDVSGPASSDGPLHATFDGGAVDEPTESTESAKAARQRLSGRDLLLSCLGGCSGDSCAVLAAGIFHRLLICHEPVLPEQPAPLAAEDGAAPVSRRQPALSRRPPSLHALGSMVASHFAVVGRVVEKEVGQSSAAIGRRGMEEMSAKVLVLAVQALERNHASFRPIVLQALVQLVLDFSTEPAAWGRPAACAAAKGAAKAGARELRKFLHEDGALHEDTSDAFLDVFTEEWEEFQREPAHVSVREVCSDARCLLPALAGLHAAGMRWALSDPTSERQQAAKAIRALLSIHRLSQELSLPPAQGAITPATLPPSTSDGTAPEPSFSGPAATSPGPLHVAEEVADGYVEGKSVELGRQDRIVCGVVTPDGRHTRYLVLHPFLLLLVQPDLVSPGFAVVRTLAPVRLAEPHIDRSDPRTLRLHLRLTRGAACPGEAMPCEPPPQGGPGRSRGGELSAAAATPGEERCGSSYFLLILSFEDVKRCHNADYHLRRRRQEVRAALQRRLEGFVEGLAACAAA